MTIKIKDFFLEFFGENIKVSLPNSLLGNRLILQSAHIELKLIKAPYQDNWNTLDTPFIFPSIDDLTVWWSWRKYESVSVVV